MRRGNVLNYFLIFFIFMKVSVAEKQEDNHQSDELPCIKNFNTESLQNPCFEEFKNQRNNEEAVEEPQESERAKSDGTINNEEPQEHERAKSDGTTNKLFHNFFTNLVLRQDATEKIARAIKQVPEIQSNYNRATQKSENIDAI